MKKVLTKQQVSRLHAAIDAAVGPGSCQYVDHGKPACVVAQLAATEGIPLETIEAWDATAPQSAITTVYGRPGTEPLQPYGLIVLSSLQRVWDDKETDSVVPVATRRQTMHAVVDELVRGV